MTLKTRTPVATAPAFRPFAVRVTARHRLSASFVRVTFTGEDLEELASGGSDQRVKLLFPLPGAERPELPAGDDWYGQWRALPRHHRSPMRTYTVRASRPLERELDVDFVLHGATGPASAWATTAVLGDEVVVVGPNARFDGPAGGVEWRPTIDARALVLAGDETAVPAISAIAEAMVDGTSAQLLLEVPTTDDVLDLDLPTTVTATWLPRRSGRTEQRRGVLLEGAVRTVLAPRGVVEPDAPDDEAAPAAPVWHVPQDAPPGAGPYVWLAGEAGVVTRLRRYLVNDVGLDRRSVAFMGYWKQGRAEGE